MLEIDEKIFNENLKITQAYCDFQMENALEKDALTLTNYSDTYTKTVFYFQKNISIYFRF